MRFLPIVLSMEPVSGMPNSGPPGVPGPSGLAEALMGVQKDPAEAWTEAVPGRGVGQAWWIQDVEPTG